MDMYLAKLKYKHIVASINKHFIIIPKHALEVYSCPWFGGYFSLDNDIQPVFSGNKIVGVDFDGRLYLL